MPIIYGIAAFAVLANVNDQVGVDPQVDKQYAIVKQVDLTKPVVAGMSDARAAIRSGIEEQDGVANIQATDGKVTYSSKLNLADIQSPATVILDSNLSQAKDGKVRELILPGMAMGSQFSSLGRLKGMDRMVSVHFNNASASDVLKWLVKQNVNFVANVDGLPKNHITTSLNNVPLHEAIETVAESLGGSWQVKGSTLIFRKGMSFVAPYTSMTSFAHPNYGDAKAYKLFDESQMKAFGKMRSDSFDTNLSYLTVDPKQFEELKSLYELSTGGKGYTFKMDPKALAELQKLQKSEKGFSDQSKLFKELKAFPDMKGMTFHKIDPDQFLKSLTEKQKDLMKRQGHLKFSDLSDAQKAMMFMGSAKDLPESFTFVFLANGQKITIKKS